MTAMLPPTPAIAVANPLRLSNHSPTSQIAVVHTNWLYATLSWSQQRHPAVYPPRGGAIAHLHLAGIAVGFRSRSKEILEPVHASVDGAVQFLEGHVVGVDHVIRTHDTNRPLVSGTWIRSRRTQYLTHPAS